MSSWLKNDENADAFYSGLEEKEKNHFYHLYEREEK